MTAVHLACGPEPEHRQPSADAGYPPEPIVWPAADAVRNGEPGGHQEPVDAEGAASEAGDAPAGIDFGPDRPPNGDTKTDGGPSPEAPSGLDARAVVDAIVSAPDTILPFADARVAPDGAQDAQDDRAQGDRAQNRAADKAADRTSDQAPPLPVDGGLADALARLDTARDATGPFADAASASDTAEGDRLWWRVDPSARTVETDRIKYRYVTGYLHDGQGMAIREFVNKATGENHSAGFDGLWLGSTRMWDNTPVIFNAVVPGSSSVDIHVTTGLTKKIDRLYPGLSGIEIQYLENTSTWTEDFIEVAGEGTDIAFVMYGMNDIVGFQEGLRVQRESEQLALMRYGHKENYGDTFIEANGSTPAQCDYKGHFIYGFINQKTGRGMGFVYPTAISIPDWRVWWTKANKIEIEFAPQGQTGKRWLYAVTSGKDEVIRVGQGLVDNFGFPAH
jgi:hypothetical protein